MSTHRGHGSRWCWPAAACALTLIVSGCSGSGQRDATGLQVWTTLVLSSQVLPPNAVPAPTPQPSVLLPAAGRGVAAPISTSIPALASGGWQLNGSAKQLGGSLQLSAAGVVGEVGSAFWPRTIVGASLLTVSFDASMGGGSGADGLTFAVLDATTGKATSLGHRGGGLGWAGLPGFAVALDTHKNYGDPSSNTVGLVTGFQPGQGNHLKWAAAAIKMPLLRKKVREIGIAVSGGIMTVAVDGFDAFSTPVSLPKKMMIGFTASNGRGTDNHSVYDVHITTS